MRFSPLTPRALQDCILAIGNFDGVHLGHQALLAEARRIADAHARTLAVLTFYPHPREFFQPQLKPLAMLTAREKCKALRECGADSVYFQYFSYAFAQMSAADFLDLCVSGLRAKHIVTGDNFTFGRGREGNATFLQASMQQRGLGFTAVPAQHCPDGEPYSSTRIRRYLQSGDIHSASKLLGRPYAIEGRVMHGDKRGRELGFPTANLSLRRLFRPAYGIYAARVEVEGRGYAAAASLGLRPQFALTSPVLEVHLAEFEGSLYGERIRVVPLHYLRPEQQFDSIQSLIDQMGKDMVKAVQLYQPKG